jgi:hypothetical protein
MAVEEIGHACAAIRSKALIHLIFTQLAASRAKLRAGPTSGELQQHTGCRNEARGKRT